MYGSQQQERPKTPQSVEVFLRSVEKDIIADAQVEAASPEAIQDVKNAFSAAYEELGKVGKGVETRYHKIVAGEFWDEFMIRNALLRLTNALFKMSGHMTAITENILSIAKVEKTIMSEAQAKEIAQRYLWIMAGTFVGIPVAILFAAWVIDKKRGVI